jgi:gas vesicle protein
MAPIIEKKSQDTNKEPETKIWNDSEVELLKRWGEVCSSYRFLHDRAFRIFQLRNYCFTIPVIVLSTISGTASFSIASFPVDLQVYVPMVIGGINIFVGIIQTIAQFLRISELAESHRVASTAYGKFSRNIATELSLPPNNRTQNGIEFVQMCRAEMDRLLEQSPMIPMNLLTDFDKNPIFQNITKPDVLKITEIREYKPSRDERVQNIVSGATEQLKNFHLQPDPDNQALKNNTSNNINSIPNINSIINKSKENANKKIEEKKNELSDLGTNKIVSGLFKNNKFLSSIPTDSFSKSYIDIKKEQAKELNNILPLIKSNLEEKEENLKNNIKSYINEAESINKTETVNKIINETINETISETINNNAENIDKYIKTEVSDIENNIKEIKNNATEIKKTLTANGTNIVKNISIKVNNINNEINESIDNIENTGLDKI